MGTVLVFPRSYQKEFVTRVPGIRFEALEIGTGRTAGELDATRTGNTVWLPMPQGGHQTSYQQGWSEGGGMKAGLSSFLSGIMNSTKKSQGQDGSDTGGGAGEDIKQNTGTIDWAGVLGEGAKSAAGIAGLTGRVLAQSFMAYSGPGYRSHSFEFSLKPESENDSTEIENIVKFFKENSAPALMPTTELARIYKVPNVFEITFVPNAGLHKIKASALETIEVKYGGEKYNIFKDDQMPVQVDISLNFKELEILNKKDVVGGF
jgi:hypothetical protein